MIGRFAVTADVVGIKITLAINSHSTSSESEYR